MSLAARINTALRRLPAVWIYPLGALPALWLVGKLMTGKLGPDPLKPLEHGLGLYALQFLIAALSVSTLLRWTGINLMRFRRALGLLAFCYALCHLAVWLGLDIQMRWGEIGQDLAKRPYIIVGALSFLLLVPLAATSNATSIRRIGAGAWRRLHLLAYPATIAAAAHFIMAIKVWAIEPLAYSLVILVLCGARLTRAGPRPLR